MDINKRDDFQNDGMRYPAIDQLITKTTSKYRLVMAAAMRAKEIKYDEEKPLVEEPKNKKSIGIALEEIYEGKITILPETGEKNN